MMTKHLDCILHFFLKSKSSNVYRDKTGEIKKVLKYFDNLTAISGKTNLKSCDTNQFQSAQTIFSD